MALMLHLESCVNGFPQWCFVFAFILDEGMIKVKLSFLLLLLTMHLHLVMLEVSQRNSHMHIHIFYLLLGGFLSTKIVFQLLKEHSLQT